MEEGKTTPNKGKQALYRRYRSTSFDELIGQEHITNLLKTAVKNGSFSHAYLFTGQRGTGKTSAARILAHAINGLPYDAENSHLDIIEIDAASNRRIDDIRDLREKVFVAPVSAKYKVYIIDEVHMLTGESFNALLKTLEEPPEHVVFILATTELHKVPATIISRTQRFHFRPVALEKVVSHLQDIATKEQIAIDEDALRLIAGHGGGSFRDSISLLDQLGSFGTDITAETVEATLGRARSSDILDIMKALEENNHDVLHTLLEHILAQGTSPVTLSEQIVTTLLQRPTPTREWYDLIEKLMAVPKAHFPQLLLVSTLLAFTAKDAPAATPVKPPSPRPEKQKPEEEKKTVVAEETQPRQAEQQTASPHDTPAAPKEAESIAETASSREENSSTGEPVNETATTNGKNTGFDWEKVLTAIKKANPALYAMLSKADHSFSDNILTLTFRYALHRKKLDQAQYRTQLSRFIQDNCGVNPTIVIDQNGPQLAGTDDTTKKVADLMGGGERVTV